MTETTAQVSPGVMRGIKKYVMLAVYTVARSIFPRNTFFNEILEDIRKHSKDEPKKDTSVQVQTVAPTVTTVQAVKPTDTDAAVMSTKNTESEKLNDKNARN